MLCKPCWYLCTINLISFFQQTALHYMLTSTTTDMGNISSYLVISKDYIYFFLLLLDCREKYISMLFFLLSNFCLVPRNFTFAHTYFVFLSSKKKVFPSKVMGLWVNGKLLMEIMIHEVGGKTFFKWCRQKLIIFD